MSAPIIRSPRTLRRLLDRARKKGLTIGFVPTMGALHRGHAELIRRSVHACGMTIVSVYVNPLQFGPKEDYSRYPRSLRVDARISGAAGANLVFAPTVEEVRRDPFLIRRRADKRLKAGLCGPFRPGHFDGVATIVGYFFDLIRPDIAFFGLKDYQQFLIVKELARRDFGSIRVRGVATQREADGLALSSRNRYLSASERRFAPMIYTVLRSAARGVKKHIRGGLSPREWMRQTRNSLACIPGVTSVQYLELATADTLRPVGGRWPIPTRRLVLATSVFMGRTRLIDHVLI